ncbi:hypothetical protein BD289DRAFT_458460 [Coniella lustricola]|uniref:Gylcosyl hydrolase 115 C-terminal domain-containing protein n=1 Tax=Coniella lustricola TaxID=2025994 RepID=A0A2T3AJD4_9PEZI|nr:hypothetical protein BD289DRAFT_458460 [Coniella lustricola]
MALRHTVFTSLSNTPGALNLSGAGILVDEEDHEGVHIAVKILGRDIARVTKGPSPKISFGLNKHVSGETAAGLIIVGCIDTSRVLQNLEKTGKIDHGHVRGKWESFSTSIVANPLPGCERALVIAGSDKRGAIYGIYTLSEQLGISPWHWWADVPPAHHPQIYALPVTTLSGEPSIRYRGIFINDEAPALSGWVHDKFGGYNAFFYEKVFELLLRLRANFLWPAMWPGYPSPGASFFTDRPENQRTADTWGIVVSTSHHEPMQRLANEWLAEGNPLGTWDWLANKDKITSFFERGAERAKPFESYFTLGMRGEYDTQMRTDDPAGVVQDVLATQRSLIKKVYGSEDAVPQLLALYKEVQWYYERGKLEIPDDVTLLFSDDNFGSLRRLPGVGKDAEAVRQRKGGAGIYYHLEYVGTPRSYKWINSNSLGKTWHQLHEAHRYGAKQIWVFNVGDIKPLEVPLTFAMTLAWDMTSKVNTNAATVVSSFLQDLARREFGGSAGSGGSGGSGNSSSGSGIESSQVAQAWLDHDRLLSLRRHEHIEPTTFSLLHYNEAEIIFAWWNRLLEHADRLHTSCSKAYQPALFQLLLHPIKASAIFTQLHITRAQNRLFAKQRRTSTNRFAAAALGLFDADFELTEEYHNQVLEADGEFFDGSLGGTNPKWKGILAQPHYGFLPETWHAPSRDMLEGLCFVQTRQASNAIMGNMGVMVQGHAGVRPGVVNENSDFMRPSKGDLVAGLTLEPLGRYSTGWRGAFEGGHRTRRWFEVYSRGTCVVHWRAWIVAVHKEDSDDHDDPADLYFDDDAAELSSWVSLSQTRGTLVPKEQDQRVYIKVRQERIPLKFRGSIRVEISSDEGDVEHIHLPITGRQVPEGFEEGFVEADRYVAMAAVAGKEVFQEKKKKKKNDKNDGNINNKEEQAQHHDPNTHYRHLPHVGRTHSGAVSLEPDPASPSPLSWNRKFDDTRPHWLEYPFFVFTNPADTTAAERCTLRLDFTLTLEIVPDHPMMYEYAIDGGDVHKEPLVLLEGPDNAANGDVELPAAAGWKTAVQDCVWRREHDVRGEFESGSQRNNVGDDMRGRHMLRLRLLHTNILLERIVLDLGGVKESYLGPPESFYLKRA